MAKTVRLVEGFDGSGSADDWVIPGDRGLSNTAFFTFATPPRIVATGGYSLQALTASGHAFFDGLASGAVWFFHVAVKADLSQSTGVHIVLDNGSTPVAQIAFTSAGAVLVRDGAGSQLAASVDNAIRPNKWASLSVRLVLDGSACEALIEVDAVERINATSLAFSDSAADRIELYGPAFWDDLLAATGLAADAIYEPQTVLVLNPDGDGDVSDFAPNTGANYAAVDDALPDGDTTYVESASVADQDLYSMASAVAKGVGTVSALKLEVRAKKTTVAPRELMLITKPTSAIQDGDSHALGTDYQAYRQIWQIDPEAASAWTASGIDAAQFGIEVSA